MSIAPELPYRPIDSTMAELLCAIEEKRTPNNNARDNLKSLALCFAALASADSGGPRKVGPCRRVPS